MLLLAATLTLTTTPTVSAGPVSSCSMVTDERWREVAAMLEGLVSRDKVCTQTGLEGNYTGQVVEGVREGWGEMRWNNGTLYGPDDIFYYSLGDKYLGQWHQGIQAGVGTLITQTGLYVGLWEEGLQVGFFYIDKVSLQHSINLINDHLTKSPIKSPNLSLQSGQGTAIYNNGNNYTGGFSRGLKHGRGVFRASTGDVFTGEFRAGVREGEGIETFYNGEKYVGQYRGDRRHGLGSAYYSSGQLKYVGEWSTLIGPNHYRYCVLIGGTLCHNNTPQGK